MANILSAAAQAANLWQNEDIKTEAIKEAEDAYGSAQWFNQAYLGQAGLLNGPILCGRSDKNQMITFSGDGHLLTFAPNGAGKSVNAVVPNTLLYPGSLCVIDPKGAIAPICARARLQRGKVWIFDPFHAVKDATLQPYRMTFNPLAFLDPESPDLIDDVRLISESLVLGESDKNAFFSDTARTVLECLILFVLASVGPEARTLESVLDLAYRDTAEFKERLIPLMQKSDAFGGILAQMANQLEGFTGDAGGSVWMTLRRSLNFLQSPRMTEALRPSGVEFSRMKDEGITVFLVLPATRLTRYGRWLRLMISMMIAALLDPRKPAHPVLFLIDEASALGNLPMLSDGIALFRGYHLKLWLFWQSLDQMQAAYPKQWQTFIANAGCKQIFGTSDFNGAKYFSDFMGNTTRQVVSSSVQGLVAAGNSNISHIQRSLQTPDEVLRLSTDYQYLLFDRMHPVSAKKLKYYADSEFAGRFDADPYQGASNDV